MAVISVLLFMMVAMTEGASKTWKDGLSKVERFREARVAFDSMTRRLSRATLNTYWDYQYAEDDVKKERAPVSYQRQSELRFRTGRMDRLLPNGTPYRPTSGIFFQAPLGIVEDEEFNTMDRLLNSTGFFLEIGDDREFIPEMLQSRVKTRVRSRLLQFDKPAEQLAVYQLQPGVPNDTWFTKSIEGKDRPVRVIAENILALVILPKLSQADEVAREKTGGKALCPKFDYDSTRVSNHLPPLDPPDPDINPHNQLPPVVMVSMFAIDEESGQRLEDMAGGDPQLGLDTQSIFQDAAKLEDRKTTSGKQAGDLSAFEQQLIDRKLKYRLFSTSVALRGAKWSRAQTQ